MNTAVYLSITLFLLSTDLLYIDVAGHKLKIGYFFVLGLWFFNPAQMWGTAMDAVRRVPKWVFLPLVPLAIAVATSGNLRNSVWWTLWLAFDAFTVVTLYAFLRARRMALEQVQEAAAHALALVALFGLIQFAFVYGLGRPVFDPQNHLGIYRLNGLSGWPHFLNIFSFLLLPMVVTQKKLSLATKAILALLIFVLAQSTAKTGWILLAALGALLLVFKGRFPVGKYLLFLLPVVAIALLVPIPSSEGQGPALSGAQKIARFAHDFTNSTSIRDRTLINEMGLKVWMKHPWFGVGPKAYDTYVFTRFDQELAGENKYDLENFLNAKNENIWIEFLAECGALFTLGFLAVLIRALWVRRWAFANSLHLGAWMALVLYYGISGQVSQTGLLTMVYAVFGIYFYAREVAESGELRLAVPAPTASRSSALIAARTADGSSPASSAPSRGAGWPAAAEARWLVLVLVLTAVALRIFVGPAVFDFSAPLVYESGDGLRSAMITRSIVDSGGYPGRNESIGAPFGPAHFDHPQIDTLNYLLIKGLAAFGGDWVEVLDAFVVLGFFLAAATAFLVLRDIGLQRPWAALGAVLFAFLPYHLLRIAPLGQPFLAAYWSVPLAVWMALRVWRGSGNAEDGFPAPFGWLLASAVAVGASGLHYAFFGAFLVIVAGAASAVARRSWRRLVAPSILVLTVALTVGLDVAPAAYHRWMQGADTLVALRTPAEAETGLSVTSMLLPQPNHRWAPARSLAKGYFDATPVDSERESGSLGLMGSLGFLVLLGVIFRRLAGARGTLTVLDRLGVLALAAVLLGIIGGFDWFPAIRYSNRISILIGFMSLAAVLLVLQRATQRRRTDGGGKAVLTAVAVIALGLIGLWDQTAPLDRSGASAFASDRDFVRQVERLLPAGTMVYPLPCLPFPQSGPMNRMEGQGHLRGYLHSKTLRWSCGAGKGREENARPLPEQLAVAAEKGFGAVYLDRRAYPDRGAAIAAELVAGLGEPVAVSPDGDRAVYRLRSAGQATAAQMLASLAVGMDFTQVDFPAYVLSTEGFSYRERWGRWTDGRVARIRFAHMLPQKFVLQLVIVAVYAPNRNLPVKVRIGDTEREFALSATVVQLDFDLRRPADTIEIELPAPTSPASRGERADPRLLGIELKTLGVIARS